MVEVIQGVLEPLGTATRELLETLWVLTVLSGLIAIACQTIPRLGRRLPNRPTNPSESNLIQLAVIALIRTFLNGFLDREIEAEQRWEEEAQRRTEARPILSPLRQP